MTTISVLWRKMASCAVVRDLASNCFKGVGVQFMTSCVALNENKLDEHTLRRLNFYRYLKNLIANLMRAAMPAMTLYLVVRLKLVKILKNCYRNRVKMITREFKRLETTVCNLKKEKNGTVYR